MPASSETILIASDHAGFELKETLEAELKSLGYAVQDLGPSTNAADSVRQSGIHFLHGEQ